MGQGFDDDVLSEWFNVLQTLASVEASAEPNPAPLAPLVTNEDPTATPTSGLKAPVAELATKGKTRQNPALTVAAVLFVAAVGAIAWAGHMRSPARRPANGLSSTPTAPFTTIYDSTSVPFSTTTVTPLDPSTTAIRSATTTTRVVRAVVRPTTATTHKAVTTTTTNPVTKRTFATTTSTTRPPSTP